MLENATPALTGNTAHAQRASVEVMSGARRNRTLFAPEGIIGSLNRNLNASASV
jgi:hypothetical protein